MAERFTGRAMKYRYLDENRIGDHICYYSDLCKMKAHYPAWDVTQKPGFDIRGNRGELDRTPGVKHCLMKVLITGVCGFVGSSLAESLLERRAGISIWGIDNLLRPGSESNRNKLRKLGVHFVHGDIRVASDFESLPAVDWVIDAAANPSVLAGVQTAAAGNSSNTI